MIFGFPADRQALVEAVVNSPISLNMLDHSVFYCPKTCVTRRVYLDEC